MRSITQCNGCTESSLSKMVVQMGELARAARPRFILKKEASIKGIKNKQRKNNRITDPIHKYARINRPHL
jgi:hypothetical protein